MSWPFIKMPRGRLSEWADLLGEKFLAQWLRLVDESLSEPQPMPASGYTSPWLRRRTGCQNDAHVARFLSALRVAGLAVDTDTGIAFPFIDEVWAARAAHSMTKSENGKGNKGKHRPAPRPDLDGASTAPARAVLPLPLENTSEKQGGVLTADEHSSTEEDSDEDEEIESSPSRPPRARVGALIAQATGAVAPGAVKRLGSESAGAPVSTGEPDLPLKQVRTTAALRGSDLVNRH
ncbi:MAG: hypothetical protein JNM89_09230 [Hyphomicrobiaceae bacterium]|nr:hypothetical protein [Hyphomicrobiaceae bacterium]